MQNSANQFPLIFSTSLLQMELLYPPNLLINND